MENNEQIIELKKKLINGEINLEEYNISLREYEQGESNGQEEADKSLPEEYPEETKEADEAAQEEEQPLHKLHKKPSSGACECPKKPYGLYALIGVLALFLVLSVYTNGFGLRATGSTTADNAGVAQALGEVTDPSIGPADAEVTIIEYSDFECPFCQRAEETVKQVLKEYEGRVRLVYKNFPLSFHNNARPAAEAGECANEQGKFWELHEKMFENRLNLKKSDIKEYAEEIGLDMDRFNSCFDSGKYSDEVDQDIADGAMLSVSGVPAFFINGKPLIGAQPIEEFRKIIGKELAK
ncbi:MAG: DsbA family protein [Nanoarchaeota archaeon]|nr:DsbA family protein [Nanoarchaeota archaeon]